jgi:hypothetical protein
MADSSDTERIPAGYGWCSGYNKGSGEACDCREFQRDAKKHMHCEECQHGKSLHDRKRTPNIPVDRTAHAIFKQMTKGITGGPMLAVRSSSSSAQATLTAAKKEAATGLKHTKAKVSLYYR